MKGCGDQFNNCFKVVVVVVVKKWTSRNTTLARVQQYMQGGWPNHVKDEDLRPYWNRRLELTIHNGCLIWGNRVVVPPEGRKTLLRDLHPRFL